MKNLEMPKIKDVSGYKLNFFVLSFFITIIVNVNAQDFCLEQIPERPLSSLIVTYDLVTCAFSITASTYFSFDDYPPSCTITNNNPVCPLGPPCFNAFCYYWILIKDNVFFQFECTFDDNVTFTNLPSGEYILTAIYRRPKLCQLLNVCILHIDQSTVTIDENVSCTSIAAIHNLNQPVFMARNGTLISDCALANNKTTTFKASDRIELKPGFRSGTGVNTHFRAFVEPFPSCKTSYFNDSDSIISLQDIISSYSNMSISQKETETINEKDSTINSPGENYFTIYPNPTTGKFNLSIDKTDGDKVLIVVLDMLGIEHYSKVFVLEGDNYTLAIDPAGKLAAGVYMVIAASENNLYRKKIVISP